MFGPEAAVGAARALIAFVAVLAVVAPIGVRTVAAASASASPVAAAGVALDGMLHACFAAVAIGALFALADYALVRRRWLRSLKMTFDEFKRDAKEQDGDPHAKSRRRQLHRTLARGGIARTREASFVVVNPTHIAIALRYAPPACPFRKSWCERPTRGARRAHDRGTRRYPGRRGYRARTALMAVRRSGASDPAESFVAVATAIAASSARACWQHEAERGCLRRRSCRSSGSDRAAAAPARCLVGLNISAPRSCS